MSQIVLKDLAVQTIRTPDLAARVLLGLNVPTQTLWMALTLTGLLNALLFGVAMVMTPLPEGAPLFALPSPFQFFVLVTLGLVTMVWALTQIGRWMGGQGSLRDVLILFTWLQFLRIVAQGAVVLLSFASGLLSMMASTGIFVVGVWIGLHFVNEGHRLGSLGKAAGLLISAGVVALMLISIVMTTMAGPMIGELSDV